MRRRIEGGFGRIAAQRLEPCGPGLLQGVLVRRRGPAAREQRDRHRPALGVHDTWTTLLVRMSGFVPRPQLERRKQAPLGQAILQLQRRIGQRETASGGSVGERQCGLGLGRQLAAA